MKTKLKQLTKENLQQIISDMNTFLSKEQQQQLENLIAQYASGSAKSQVKQNTVRMSQEIVEEKMAQFKIWMNQIDEGELMLDVEEYEDYSDDYWDREWVTEYYDNQGIGDKILYAVQLAKDCVDDFRYEEANLIYEWLWEMEVCTESEYSGECDPADLQDLAEHNIVKTDLKQLALLTLYAGYQALDADRRAEDLYLYFSHRSFQNLHLEDMLHVGRENLADTEQFWADWIALLKTEEGDVEARLLQEAVLYQDGVEGLITMADEVSSVHPSLYLGVMEVYDQNHEYEQIEQIGETALAKLNKSLKIRGNIALKAAYAASCLSHDEQMMRFCWECFCSDSTVRNFLRLFGTTEMAEQYGTRGKEAQPFVLKGGESYHFRIKELSQNQIGKWEYYDLCFYTGDFDTAKRASKNPSGSLGWSSSFIDRGIRLFLLYLYEDPKPSKAASVIAQEIGFADDAVSYNPMYFESAIAEESRTLKVSIFWNYFQRWKQYFPMGQDEREKNLAWAEKIVYSRADAIVSGQHRSHYREAAVLLALIAENKEAMGVQGVKREVYAEYKKKFPRHSSFQGEMNSYFGFK
ncbi:MAG: hypothetical protein K2L86_15145 [Lachnospiraceae bacterium]|nr:hypothetical protein [Lachnospiraceae bacterium]